MQVRRGDKRHASLRDEILNEGQPFYEIDTNKLKIGDGKHSYNNLPYIAGGNIKCFLKEVPANSVTSNTVFTLTDPDIKEESLIFVYPTKSSMREQFMALNLTGNQSNSSLVLTCNNAKVNSIEIVICVVIINPEIG